MEWRKCGDSGFRGKCSHTSRRLGERCIREPPECPSRVVHPSERRRYAPENHPSAKENSLSARAKELCARELRLSAHKMPERPRERLMHPSEVGMRPRTTTIHPRKKVRNDFIPNFLIILLCF